MEKFYCKNCQKIFKAKGKKKEWESSIFGKQWKLVAECPFCHQECEEYRPEISKKGKDFRENSCPLCSLGR